MTNDKQLDDDIRAAQDIYRHKSRAVRAVRRVTASDLTAPKYVPDNWPVHVLSALDGLRQLIEHIPHFRPQDHDLAEQISDVLGQAAFNTAEAHANASRAEHSSEGQK